MSSSIPDHVTMATDLQSTTLGIPVVKGRAVIDFDRYPRAMAAKFSCYARKQSGGSGYIKIWDYTKAQQLALITVNASDPTLYTAELANVPESGVSLIELQIYTDGTGTIQVTGAVVEVG